MFEFTFFLCSSLFPHFFVLSFYLSFFFLSKPILNFFPIEKILEQIFNIDDSLSFVQVLDVLECFHEFHFSFGVIAFVLQVFHGIFLLFVYF